MRVVLAGLASLALSACAHTAHAPAEANHPEARSYDASIDATAAVDGALARAMERGTRVLLVMGANWCHDSRALASLLETPRFSPMIDEHFELVFVNVGMPQTEDGHNLHIASRFGIEALPGTPNLLVIDADGTLLNPESATSWRNAASRDSDAVYAEIADFTSN